MALVPFAVRGTGPGPVLRTRQKVGAGDRGGAVTRARAYLPEGLGRFFDRSIPTPYGGNLDGLAEPSPADTRDAPEGRKLLAKSYSSQAGSRVYQLYVPTRYPRQSLPLII